MKKILVRMGVILGLIVYGFVTIGILQLLESFPTWSVIFAVAAVVVLITTTTSDWFIDFMDTLK